MGSPLLSGALAGAAGTTALNAVTYLDMALRSRPASDTPEETVRKAEDLTGQALSSNSRSGLGALLGIASGVGMGTIYGALRSGIGRSLPLPVAAVVAGVGAGAATNAPMTALGVSDPRTWPASSWLADLVPHLAYGVVTALTYDIMSRRVG